MSVIRRYRIRRQDRHVREASVSGVLFRDGDRGTGQGCMKMNRCSGVGGTPYLPGSGVTVPQTPTVPCNCNAVAHIASALYRAECPILTSAVVEVDACNISSFISIS